MDNIACRLIEAYGIAANFDASDIKNFKTYKSNVLGMQNLYSFEYRGNKYYASDDYTLEDNPENIKRVIEDIGLGIAGEPLKNPTPQSDGAIYACGIDGVEYYLWKSN